MSDPFDLPERDLPEHIRQAAFRRIMTEIADVRPRRRTGLAPLLIAASVIALVAGATIVTSTLNNKDSKPLNASPTSHPTATTTSGLNSYNRYDGTAYWGDSEEMQRCWAAGRKPDHWLPLLKVDRNGLIALLYQSDNDLVFCELTAEQVTVKTLPYPNPPTGDAPATIMFTTAQGTYAGVTAPGVNNLTIDTGNVVPEPAAVNNGVFILPNSYRQTDQLRLRTEATGYPGYAVPKADLPQPTPVTRTGSDPKADRTSPAGQRLGACLNAANPPMVDADWWTTGATQEVDSTHSIQLGAHNGGLLACQQNNGQLTADGPLSFEFVGGGTGFTAKISKAEHGPPGLYFVGHTIDAQAKTATLTVPGEADVTGTIVDDTFVLYRPHALDPTSFQGTVTVKNAADAVIDQIPVHY